MDAITVFDRFAPQAFIFDFDGTLGDSMDVWLEVDRLFLERYNLPETEEYKEMIVALGFEAGASWVVDNFDIGMTAEEIVQEWIDLSFGFYQEFVELKPFAKIYLEQLRAAGYPLAIATSLRRDLLELALKRNGVFDYFDALCICDELGSAGKLDPTVYLEAAKQLGYLVEYPLALSDCVVFEDVALAANTARQAGAYVIGVLDGNGVSKQEEMAPACDKLIRSFDELLSK